MLDGNAIIAALQNRFMSSGKPWDYLYGSDGSSVVTFNGLPPASSGPMVSGPGIDCSNLVYQTLLAAGYDVSYLESADLNGIAQGTETSSNYTSIGDEIVTGHTAKGNPIYGWDGNGTPQQA